MLVSDLPKTFTNFDYTFAYSKVICIAQVYPVHIISAYLLALIGILALLSRVVNLLKPYHVWFGRMFLIIMYWCIASSLLIRNIGLPTAITFFFVIMLITLTIGYTAIKFHQEKMNNQSLLLTEEKLSTTQSSTDLKTLIQESKEEILDSRTFKQRIFSLKTLHGVCMTLCWYQIFGRAASLGNPQDNPGCYTYPAYKSLDGTIKLIPDEEEGNTLFSTTNGVIMFSLFTQLPIFLIVFIFPLIYTYVVLKLKSKSRNYQIVN